VLTGADLQVLGDHSSTGRPLVRASVLIGRGGSSPPRTPHLISRLATDPSAGRSQPAPAGLAAMRAVVAEPPGTPEVPSVCEIPRPAVRGWTLVVDVEDFGLNRWN
jgi:hypothetical protein